MRTCIVTFSVAVALGVTAAGCGHFGKSEEGVSVRYASTAAATPVTTSSVSSLDAAETKKAFCAVFSQEIQKTENATARFGAASRGDEQHPETDWGDPDHWFRDAADNASIIFGYAADVLQAQITSSLPPDLSTKAKDLVASMRKLSELYRQHEAVANIKDTTENQYGAAANGVDRLCGTA